MSHSSTGPRVAAPTARPSSARHSGPAWPTLPSLPAPPAPPAARSGLLARAAAVLGAGLLGVLALAGCQSLSSQNNFLGVITPYRIEVVQGNVVTKEQAAAIRPGMSRTQVRDVLGSPLLTDPFHGDRWDYVFTIRRQGAEPQLRRVVILFAGDSLKSIDTGGPLPSELDFVASIDTFKTSRNAPSLELSEEQVRALPAPPRPAASDAEPVGPTRVYPPLEPNS